MANIVFRPHPGPQTRFLASGARDVFFGGAAGPGKSVCLLAEGFRYFGLRHYRGKIFRRTRKMATELILKANRFMRAAFPEARWNGAEHAFINPRGGRLEIGYLRHDMDLENEEGQEYQMVGFDELCQFPEHQARFLNSRLRSAEGLPLKYRGTGNPRGIGLQWVKGHYVDPAEPETVHWQKYQLPDGRTVQVSTMFVPGRLEDNPTLGDDYEISLAALGDPRLYQALRHGDWNALVGDAFPDWDPTVHLITWAQFAKMHGKILNADGTCDIPEGWPIFEAYDWGQGAPFSVGWYTTDPLGRLYRVREWYGVQRDRQGKSIPNKGLQMPTRMQARGILEREALWKFTGRVQMRVADPAIFNSRGVDNNGPSYGEMMAEEGVYHTRGNNDRQQGKGQFHDRLRISDHRHPDGRREESPGFFVIKESNPDWRRTVPVLPRDPKNPEDVDTTAEDHNYDETRYMLMARPWKPVFETAAKRRHLDDDPDTDWTHGLEGMSL